MNEQQPKFCKDCRYLVAVDNQMKYAVCSHLSTVSWDLVAGRKVSMYAMAARVPGGICGPSAKLFEPKEVEKAA